MLGNKYVAAVVGLMLIVVVAYNINYFLSRRGSAASSTESVSNIKAKSDYGIDRAETVSDKKTGAEAVVNYHWKRDPFSIKAGVEGKVPDEEAGIKLTGIIKGTKSGYALINGRIYRAKERIGNTVIKEIKQHSIVIQTGSVIQEIDLDNYKVTKERKK